MKALTPVPLTLGDRSLRLPRLAFPAFRPQPRDPPDGRFVRRISATGCFQASPGMSRLATKSRRNRFVTLQTASSPPVALHLASRRRSYVQLRSCDQLPHGLPPCRQSALAERTHARERGHPGLRALNGLACAKTTSDCAETLDPSPGSYGDVIVKGSIRYRFGFRAAPGLMGFDADVRPEGADWPVEAHGCATPEARAAVNPRVSDREAAARVSEAGLTASTTQAPAQASGSRRGGVGPRTGSQAGRARASWGGLSRRRAKRLRKADPRRLPFALAARGRQARIRRRSQGASARP